MAGAPVAVAYELLPRPGQAFRGMIIANHEATPGKTRSAALPYYL